MAYRPLLLASPLLLAVSLALAPSTRPAAVPLTLTTTDAPPRVLLVAAYDGTALTLADGSVIDAASLVRLNTASDVAQSQTLTLVLRDGQRLPGAPAPGSTPESVAWSHPVFGLLHVPLKLLAAIDRPPFAGPSAPAAEDVAVLANGDSVRGIVSETSTDAVTLSPSAGGDPVKLPWGALRRLTLADTPAPAAGATPAFRAELTDGTIVLATSATVSAGTLSLTSPLTDTPVSVPLPSLAVLERLTGPARSLALLTPTEIVHRPYLTAARPPVLDARLPDTARVLRLTSFTRLTWTVPDGYTKLRLTFALDPTAAPTGAATFRVLAGDKLLHEAPAAATPTFLTLDLPPGTPLTLESDFGPSAGVLSRVVVHDPLLLK